MGETSKAFHLSLVWGKLATSLQLQSLYKSCNLDLTNVYAAINMLFAKLLYCMELFMNAYI